MNEHNLEFYIPDGAQIIPDSATATTENGNPLKSAPVPEGEKNRYCFHLPLASGLDPLRSGVPAPLHRQRQCRSQVGLSAGTLRGHGAEDDAVHRRLCSGRIQVGSTTRRNPSQRRRSLRTPRPARTSPSRSPAKARSKRHRKAALKAAAEGDKARARTGAVPIQPPRRRTRPADRCSRPAAAIPLVDLRRLRRSTAHRRRLRAMRQQSAARALARQRSGVYPRSNHAGVEDDYEPPRQFCRAQLQQRVPPPCCSKASKKNSSSSKSNANKAKSRKPNTKEPSPPWTRPWTGR